jgi:AcrR family transcriptional regulator
VSEPVQRRQYNSELRRQQAEETRQRILAAGARLLHVPRTWNWPALTIRTVAAQAGVNERTVYRYFGSERELREAVLDQLEAEAGIDLDGVRLEDIPEASRRAFEYFSTFPPPRPAIQDPGVAEARQRKRAALLAAIEPATGEWRPADREVAAAMLDLLWNVCSYQQLMDDWDLDPRDASRGLTWLIRLLQEAISAGRSPDEPGAGA